MSLEDVNPCSDVSKLVVLIILLWTIHSLFQWLMNRTTSTTEHCHITELYKRQHFQRHSVLLGLSQGWRQLTKEGLNTVNTQDYGLKDPQQKGRLFNLLYTPLSTCSRHTAFSLKTVPHSHFKTCHGTNQLKMEVVSSESCVSALENLM